MISLTDTMYLLECYRVVLLQLPVRFYPTTLLGGISTVGENVEDDRQSLLRAMTTYDLPDMRIETPEVSMQGLCSLALLASHGRQLPGSLLALLKSPTDVSSNHSGCMGWQQEYIELALQKWNALHTTPPTASAQLLFHLIQLNLYCSFAEVERMWRASDKDKVNVTQAHAAHQDLSSQFEMDLDMSNSETVLVLKRCFNTSENLDKAVWHANRMLDIAADFELASFSQCNGQIHLRQEASKAQGGEPIHFAHAVYHCTMVLRTSSLLQKSFQQGEVASKSRLDSISRRGWRILSRSSSRAAAVFKQILDSLQTSPLG